MENRMPDLRVIAVIPAATGSEDVVRRALRTLADASRGHDGCTGYELFESAAAPGQFLTIETWRSQADVDAHLQHADVAAAFAAAEGHLAGGVAIHPLQPVLS
jgi:quinol monooxygenase YgiN